MKKALFFFLFASLALFLPVSFKRLTRGFKLAKLRLEMPFRSDWKIAQILPENEVQSILRQPYSYLDKGAQCYVFQSKDKKYVIKLFRYDQPLYFRSGKRSGSSFHEKIEKLFSACILAYEKVREETGLVYLHLNLTSNELPILRATGPIHQTLHLPLDRYRFALQKKVEPFRKSLSEACRAGDKEAVKGQIDSFVAILHSRIKKGIGNSDPTVSRNFGFFEGKAVEIDFGNYYPLHGQPKEEMQRHTRRLSRWLKKNAPEWVSYLDQRESQVWEKDE